VGTEVAKAYVSLVPTARGFGAAINSQIGADASASPDRQSGQVSAWTDPKVASAIVLPPFSDLSAESYVRPQTPMPQWDTS
jgi:hypothetical protein